MTDAEPVPWRPMTGEEKAGRFGAAAAPPPQPAAPEPRTARRKRGG